MFDNHIGFYQRKFVVKTVKKISNKTRISLSSKTKYQICKFCDNYTEILKKNIESF